MPTGLQGSGKDGNNSSSNLPVYSPSLRAHHPAIAPFVFKPDRPPTVEEFYYSLPPAVAGFKQVRCWLYSWFFIDDRFEFVLQEVETFVSRIWLRGRFLHDDRVTMDILVEHFHHANLYYDGGRGIFSGRTRIIEALAESIILAREEVVAEV
jgi:hypothetical protein